MTKLKGEPASCAPNVAQLVSSTAGAWGARLLSAVLLMGLASGPATAQDFFWDGGTVNGGNPAANANGGSGTWNTTITNWDTAATGGADVAWVNGNNNAFFGGTAGTVTLGEPITAHNITFSTAGYTLTGDTLTLDGVTPTITGTGTISSVIAGTAGLTTGGGANTLTLSGANTFTGPLTIAHGIISVNTGSVVLAPGASLATSAITIGTAPAAGPTIVAILQNQADNQLTNATVTFNAVAPRWAYWQLLGTSQSVVGIVDSTGAGVIENTEQHVGFGNSTLTLTGSGNYSFNGFMRDHAGGSGTLALVKNGTGTQTLSGGSINYSGPTTVNSGRLILHNASNFRSATSVNSGGTLSWTGTANLNVLSSAHTIALNNGGTLENLNPANWTVLNGAVTNTGTTTINQTSNATGVAAEGLYLDGGLKGTGTVTINAANAGSGVNFRNNNTTFTGAITVNGIASSTAFAGSGIGVGGCTTCLTNADITLNGTMELLNQGIGWANTASGVFNMGALNGTGVMVGNFTGSGAQTAVTLGHTNNNGSFSGVIADGTGNTVRLVKAGTGTQALSGLNTYSGSTTITGGTLSFNSIADAGVASALGAGSTIVSTPATSGTTPILNYTGTGHSSNRTWTMGGASGSSFRIRNSGSGTLTLTGNIAINVGGVNPVFFEANGADLQLLGVMSSVSPHNVTFSSTSGRTITLGGANTRGGVSVITGATVVAPVLANLGVASSLGTGGGSTGGILINPNGILSYTGAGAGTNRAYTFNNGTIRNDGSGALALSGTMMLNFNPGTLGGSFTGANTISGVIGSTGSLRVDTAGTWILTGANTYAGTTTISAGTLQIGDGGTTGTIGTGAVTNNAALVFNRSDLLTVANAIGGTGAVTQAGAGTTVLTGNNSYSGQTTVSGGALIVNGDQTAAANLTSVNNGGALGGVGIIGGNVIVADGGSLSPGNPGDAPGTLTMQGLSLSSGSLLNYDFGQANQVGGPLNDLTNVNGDLALDGTLNVTTPPGGSFLPGFYRIFNYTGNLTNGGLVLGSPTLDLLVQTSIANQVNLVNTAGLTLNFWDGAGARNNGAIEGGDGVWQSSSGNDNWTTSTGNPNAPYASGAFAIFVGAPGAVTVDNSLGQVASSGMQFGVDGYRLVGGPIQLVGAPTVIRVGDGTTAGASFTATIDNQLFGASQLVKDDLGALALNDNNTYTGGTAINAGTLRVSRDANLGDMSGGLTFAGGTLQNTAAFTSARTVALNAGGGTFRTDADLTLIGAISGSGALAKTGGAALILTGDGSDFTGTTSIELGTLSVNGSVCGDVNVLAGGRLQGTGTVCNTNNFAGGTVAPGNSIGTLTVAGDYTGTGGTLEIETQLGGDASPTDRLVVTGNTSGTSNVNVINVGGTGAQTKEGIKIIEVGGTSAGTFGLLADYLFQGEQAVVGGAYAYRLYPGGVSTPADGDWYLRSTFISPENPEPQPLYQPGVPLYEAYAGALQSLNELGTLQQRVGNRSWGGRATPQGADLPGQGRVEGRATWARIEAAHAEFDPETSTSDTDYAVTTWKLQAGVDGLLHESKAGLLIGGITVHYGTASSDVSSNFGTGSIDATGYGFGGTLTWYGNSGLYVDAQAQATWYDSDLESATLGTTLADGNDGFGYALSVEAGQKIPLSDNWSLTPQAQLGYSSVDFDDFIDPFGAAVALDGSDALIGRLGLSVDYEDIWQDEAGKVSRAHVYSIVNLDYDFLDGSDVDVSGVSFSSENQALWGGLGLGGTLSWADGRYAVYGEVIARTSLEDFGDSNSIGGKLGFSVKW